MNEYPKLPFPRCGHRYCAQQHCRFPDAPDTITLFGQAIPRIKVLELIGDVYTSDVIAVLPTKEVSLDEFKAMYPPDHHDDNDRERALQNSPDMTTHGGTLKGGT